MVDLRGNGWGDTSWLTPHSEYVRLGDTAAARCHVYRALVMEHINEQDLHLIRKAAHYFQPVGDDRFREEIEKRYGLKLGQMKRGRPSDRKADLVEF